MKTKIMFAVLSGMAVAAMAQENDDMYFTRKDRRAAVEQQLKLNADKYRQEDANAVKFNPVNPSDTYSGRGLNPEYTSQPKAGTQLIEEPKEEGFFQAGYQPKVNSNSYTNNCNCNSAFSNPWRYGNMYSPYSSMYSPYGLYSPYSSFYSPYSSFYSPYSMYGGMYSPYYSGFGLGYGLNSYYGLGGYYGGYYGGGMYGYNPYYGYGSYYGGYPTVVTNNDFRGYVDTRRPNRSSSMNNYVSSNRQAVTYTRPVNGGRVDAGRVRTNDYYQSNWRNTVTPTRSAYSNYSGGSNWSTGSRSSWGSGATRSSFGDNGFGGGSRSSFGNSGFSGGGGGSRSSGGGGGGGHSRGRN